MSLNSYQFFALLGSGVTGRVYLAHDPLGNKVAIKSMVRRFIPLISRNESEMMKIYPRHDNVVVLYEKIEEPEQIHLILEYVGKDNLMTYVNRCGPMSEFDARTLFRGIISGVNHLHTNGIVHRDLKCENILLTPDLKPKICDLGFATKWKKNHLLSEFCGSFHYASPEILGKQPYEGPGIDIWSIGVVLYAIVAKQLPWDGTRDEMISCINRGDYWSLEFFSVGFRELLDNVLQPDPHLRWTIQQIQNCTWFQEDPTNFLQSQRGIHPSDSNSSTLSQEFGSTWSASGRRSGRSLFSSKHQTGPEKIERSGKFTIKKPNEPILDQKNPRSNLSEEIEEIPQLHKEIEVHQRTQPKQEPELTEIQLQEESQDTLTGLEELLSKLETKERKGFETFRTQEQNPPFQLGKTGKTTSLDLSERTWSGLPNIFLSEESDQRKVQPTKPKASGFRKFFDRTVGGFSPRAVERGNSTPSKGTAREGSIIDRIKNTHLARFDTS